MFNFGLCSFHLLNEKKLTGLRINIKQPVAHVVNKQNMVKW